jgi:hypothetical protein
LTAHETIIEYEFMYPLRLLIGCCLSVLCWTAGAVQVRPDDDKGSEPQLHRQAKLAGRANNLANANEVKGRQKNEQNQEEAKTAPERRTMSQEERRALRRQISETEVKYPRH